MRRKASSRGIRLLRWLVAAGLLVCYALLYRSAAQTGLRPLYATLGTFLLLGVSTLGSVALVAQFVLPVQSREDRRGVINQLLSHLGGGAGPVMFIQAGVAIKSARETNLQGPGVILVDHVSAAVLRTDTRFTRVVAPGSVVFTERGERLAEAVDLRRQRRVLQGHQPTTGAESQQERISTLATTRDGIPISATLSITFMLQRSIPINKSAHADPPPYRFNSRAVQQAVVGRVHSEGGDLPWTELPLPLLIELWREQIKEYSLEGLIPHDPHEHAPYPEIEQAILTRLTQPVPSENQSSTGTQPRNPEFDLLNKRGMRVLEVSIEDIRIPEEIREERLLAWFENWAGPTQLELAEAEQKVRQAALHGEGEASRRLAHGLTEQLRAGIRTGSDYSLKETVEAIFQDASTLAKGEARLTALLPSLGQVMQDLRERDDDCRPRGKGRSGE